MSGYFYFAFTILLLLVLIGVAVHYYNPKRKDKVERPKYRILDEDDK